MNIKGLNETTRLLLQQFIGEVRREAYAEGFEAGKAVAETWSNANPVSIKSSAVLSAESIEQIKELLEKSILKNEVLKWD